MHWPQVSLTPQKAIGKEIADLNSFAYAEIRTAAANILTRFDVERADEKVLDYRQYITMQFSDGSWNVLLTPRKTK